MECDEHMLSFKASCTVELILGVRWEREGDEAETEDGDEDACKQFDRTIREVEYDAAS